MLQVSQLIVKKRAALDAPSPFTVQLLKTSLDLPGFEDEVDAAEADQQVVLGVVYMPDVVDSHGDFMNALEIRKAAYEFMERGDTHAVDLQHNNVRTGAYIVESFIVRDGDLDFPIPGSWVVGVHIPDPSIWAAVKAGEINGFSMEALVNTEDSSVATVAFPALLQGETAEADGHTHGFEVVYDSSGNFAGGMTDEQAGSDGIIHAHDIKRGVVTEPADGHAHRFALIELVQGLDDARH